MVAIKTRTKEAADATGIGIIIGRDAEILVKDAVEGDNIILTISSSNNSSNRGSTSSSSHSNICNTSQEIVG